MSHTIRQLEDLLAAQLGNGLTGAAIELHEGYEHGIELLPRSIPRKFESTIDEATVTVWLEEGRKGVASGATGSLDALLHQAKISAERAPVNRFAGPTTRNIGTAHRGLDIDDRRYGQIDDDARLEILIDNEKSAARVDRRVKSSNFSYRDARTRHVFANSAGISGEYHSTTFDIRGSVNIRASEPLLKLDGRAASRSFSTIACLPFGANLARRAAALAGRQHGFSGPVRILLPPQATAQLLLWLGKRFEEEAASPGSTLLNSGGAPFTFGKALHIVDDGALPGGLRSRAFDAEGVPSSTITLLREGIYSTPMLSQEQARAVDRPPTGHWVDGRLQVSNLQMNSGTRSMNAHLGEQNTTVFRVDDLFDLSGLDPKTGEMDVPVHGQLMEGQEVVGVIRHARLKGNLAHALQNIICVTSDTDRILSVDAAGLIIDGLQLAR